MGFQKLPERTLALEEGHQTYQGKPCKYGHPGLRATKSGECIECIPIRRKAYALAHVKERATSMEKWRNNNLARALWSQAMNRAKRTGVDFTISPGDVDVPETCPVLGVRLRINRGKRQDDSPSLDRLDNAFGYIPGNVRVISWRANRLKSDATPAELSALATYANQKADFVVQ